MQEFYFKLKNYIRNNNPIPFSFLLVYPSIVATFGFFKAVYITVILSLLLTSTKMIFIICDKFSNKNVAHFLFSLFVSTYISIIYLITNALFPYQIKALVIITPVFILYYILGDNLGHTAVLDRNISHAFYDGILFSLCSFCFIVIISSLDFINVFNNKVVFSLVNFAIATLLIKCIIIVFEKFLDKKYTKKG